MAFTDNITPLRGDGPAHEIESAKSYLRVQCPEWKMDINRGDLILSMKSPQLCRGIVTALEKLSVYPNQSRKAGETILQVTEAPQIENLRRIGIQFNQSSWPDLSDAISSPSAPGSRGR